MTDEKGYQTLGLMSWGSLADEAHETNPDLQWPKSNEVYDKMRREDAQVGSVFRAVTLPVRKTGWMIDPAGARDEVVELVAQDLGLPIRGRDDEDPPLRTKDRFSWAEHLRQHHRVSNADADLQREVVRFHTGPEAPKVQHLIGVAPPG